MKKLISTVWQMSAPTDEFNNIKMIGAFISDDLTGDYTEIEAPEHWKKILTDAIENTGGIDDFELGEENDWQWWEGHEIRDGVDCGACLVAQWKEESRSEAVADGE